MNVSLTPELEEFVAKKVSSGRYQTASEVVREGLRLLEERDRPKPSFMVSSLEELQEKLREGIESLGRGEFVEFKNDEELHGFFDKLKAEGRHRLKRSAKKPL